MAITDNIANLASANSFGGALSSIGNIGDGIGGAIKKIRSLAKNQKEPSTIRDLYTNGFLSQDSQFVPNFFARAFDEPTYLTFKVEFNFGDTDSFHRNLAYNNNGLDYELIENTRFNTMYDYLPEPLLEPYRTNKTKVIQLETRYEEESEDNSEYTVNVGPDTSTGETYSTEHYLDITLGEHGRAYLLHNFKLALKDLQENFPYYLKSISGIGNLFKVDPVTGLRLKDATITLDCYEALDLRITQLLNTYKKIVWDDVYQRWILPDMMRYFNMKIYISEIRLFHDFVPNKPKNDKFIYDFSNPNVRNSTTSPLIGDKDVWWEKGLNAINTATALSSTFLGTKSHLTKAINTVTSTIETGKGLYNDIAGAVTDLNMCNSAFNEVMPTICIDCHMCEFDISDTMSHIDNLKSSKPESPNPKITIKIGNAKDIQAYPLNTSLRLNSTGDGYIKTITQTQSKLPDKPSYNDLYISRDNPSDRMFIGNYISDTVLNDKYTQANIGLRQDEYVQNLGGVFGTVTGQTLQNKKMNRLMRNDSSTMKYPRGYIPQDLARISLTSAGIQEAQSVTRAFDKEGGTDLEYIIGTHSTATSPDKATIQAIKAIGDTLNEALDKIYNGDEMKSMAVSEEMKNKIASDMFDEYMKTQDNSTATNKNIILHKIIEQYDAIKNDDNVSISRATDKNTNEHKQLETYKTEKFNELN